ncbi:MAG: hypothetical protein WCX73_02260 [Candidatus Pacearchaeota archaeon]|jgi:hypothetical protein
MKRGKLKEDTSKKPWFLGLIIALAIIPLISAYSWGSWGYYSSPLDYLDNEWVIFGIYFLIFFTIVFFTVNKAFQNPAVAGVIALGFALLISLVMAQKGLLYGYLGEQIGSWILIITILIGLGFLLRFVYESFGKIGAIVTLIGLWIAIRSIDPYEFLPYELLTDTFINIYGFFASVFGGIVLIAIALIILNITDTKTIGERLISSLGKRGR